MITNKLESGNAVLQTIQSSEGGRAFKLLQKRQKKQQELESAKHDIENETKKRRFNTIDDRYKGSTTEALEEAFKLDTVGLVSAEEFKEKRKRLQELLREESERSNQSDCSTSKSKPDRFVRSKLSFGGLEDEEEDEGGGVGSQLMTKIVKNEFKSPNSDIYVKKEQQRVTEKMEVKEEGEGSIKVEERMSGGSGVKDEINFNPDSDNSDLGQASTQKKKFFGKDPTVNTSFLADVEREERLLEEKRRVTRMYYEAQEKIKEELLEVTYSYWDGSGHRRVARIKKGSTIGQFLNECQRSLERDFPELRTVSSDNLLYIKEDLILPHSVSFHELIKNQARGKSGPLFNFDVHDDVRIINDARVEKDESHAGKIVERKWYDRNKHIFPASRWETYDPSKTYEKYTIHG